MADRKTRSGPGGVGAAPKSKADGPDNAKGTSALTTAADLIRTHGVGLAGVRPSGPLAWTPHDDPPPHVPGVLEPAVSDARRRVLARRHLDGIEHRAALERDWQRLLEGTLV